MLFLKITMLFHLWNELWVPSFNWPWWSSTPPGGATRPWSRISFHSHAGHVAGWFLRQRDFIPLWVVKLSTVNHAVFHFTSSKKWNNCNATLQNELMQCWWFFLFLTFLFAGKGLFPPFCLLCEDVSLLVVKRGACGDGYLGFRRPLWFGLIGFVLGKWWPMGTARCERHQVWHQGAGEESMVVPLGWYPSCLTPG